MDYYTSKNGRSFSKMGTVECNFPDNEYGAFTKNFTFAPPQSMQARYVKIGAHNYGVCPKWHLGDGGTTWVFADEITVE